MEPGVPSSLERVADLPPLPSSTNGPMSFRGVMGQSGARSAPRPREDEGKRGERPACSFAPVTLIATGCVTDEEGAGPVKRRGVAGDGARTGWSAITFNDSAMLMFVIAASRSARLWPFSWGLMPSASLKIAVDSRGVTWRSSSGSAPLATASLFAWATSSFHSSNSPGSSTSASRSVTARQLGHKKLGQVGPLSMGRMHL